MPRSGGPYTYGKATALGTAGLVMQVDDGLHTVVYNDPISGQASNLDAETSAVGLYLYDKAANPVGILSDAGAREYTVSYDPYGTPTVVSGGESLWYQYTPYGFKAGTRTANEALLKFGLRWYMPSTGTWTQRDTLDAPLDPANANRYGYAGDDPVNASDLTGLLSGSAALGLAGTIYGLSNALNTGNSKTIAEFAVNTVVGSLSTATCEGIAGAAIGGVGAALAGEPCNIIGGAVGNAVVGENPFEPSL